MGKRDRWDSSSDEEEVQSKAISQPVATSTTTRSNSTHESNNNNSNNPLPNSGIGYNPLVQGCRSVYDWYERIARVNEGTYGVVWKARHRTTHHIVALKQMKLVDSDRPLTSITTSASPAAFPKDGFPVNALREIQVLLALQHESLVSVHEVVMGKAYDQVYLVMDFYEFDVRQALDQYEGPLAQGELKYIVQQVLSALAYMHSHFYLHRDLKPSNLLVQAHTGKVAVADLGLARHYTTPYRTLTGLVCTLWYRAPELLLGQVRYGPSVDVWSVGCILGELITKDAILPGQGELDQLDAIFTLVGLPNTTTWPGYTELPHAGMFRWKQQHYKEPTLAQRFPVGRPTSSQHAFLDAHGYDLLQGLLRLDPAQRLTAEQALHHTYFQQGVAPQRPRFLVQTKWA
jgi:cell division cycle 2-like